MVALRLMKSQTQSEKINPLPDLCVRDLRVRFLTISKISKIYFLSF